MARYLIAALALVLLSACQSSTAEQAPINYASMSKCELVADLLSNPWATTGQQAAALEFGRNYGCFGPAQQQRIQVEVRN